MSPWFITVVSMSTCPGWLFPWQHTLMAQDSGPNGNLSLWPRTVVPMATCPYGPGRWSQWQHTTNPLHLMYTSQPCSQVSTIAFIFSNKSCNRGMESRLCITTYRLHCVITGHLDVRDVGDATWGALTECPHSFGRRGLALSIHQHQTSTWENKKWVWSYYVGTTFKCLSEVGVVTLQRTTSPRRKATLNWQSNECTKAAILT